MFSPTHLGILIGAAILITVLLIYCVKKQVPLETILTVMVVVTVFSEMGKVFSRIVVADGVALLAPEFLPLHLCSIQIFLFWYLKFFCKSESVKKTLLAFMYPTCLMGGIAALVIATVTPVSFANPEIYEYFGYHTMVVFFGLYVALTHQVDLTWKRLLRTLEILAILYFFSIYANSIFSAGGKLTNFLYSAFPPMEGLPYLNFSFFGRTLASEKLGWMFYLLKMIILGGVLMFVTYAPFLFRRKRTA